MTRTRPGRLLPGALLALLSAVILACLPARAGSIENDRATCSRGSYRVQAACLDAIREMVDQDVEALVEREAGRFCVGADAAAVRKAQNDWLSYRTMQCNLIERSPGDGASMASASLCRLLLARQRAAALAIQAERAQPRCPELQLSAAASKPGVPDETLRRIPGSDYAWRIQGKRRATSLAVRRYPDDGRAKTVAELDLSACAFCSGHGGDCEKDGIFVLQQSAMPSRPFVLAVCHLRAQGRQLRLLDPQAFGSAVQLQVTGDERLDWALEKGRLRVVADRTEPIVWPPEER
ncbi:Protein of unknown function [Tistlia consotensis]|uniref:Uncharacterized protein n=1 Tax=Tistlia consotensis USBA 355 TaxID=560819 RepID=A0A1Y6CG39_9PROT|nr:lysozyme inhibitor LprI family protein [Tistlia consotensis]SMF60058.1 Protein of unknown function [Tistlia consotensis USBA 355]SNR93980.1 Protein of unknown function [Tistlia consotensis]